MSQTTCILCPVYRDGHDPRLPDRPPACEGCRRRLGRDLADLPALHTRLVDGDPAEADERWYAERDRQGRLTGHRRRADPLAAFGGAGAVRSPATGARVTGSRDRQVPVHLRAVDLTAKARHGAVRDTLVPAVVLRPVTVTVRRLEPGPAGPVEHVEQQQRVQRVPLVDECGRPVLVAAGDQVGDVAAATVLDAWVQAWRQDLFPGTARPPARVEVLAGWLGDRLDEALARYEPVADFAAEIRALTGGMRAALGEVPERPEVMTGVPCARCDMRSQIWRWPDGWRECAGEYGCGRLYSEQEWRDWLAGDVVGALIAAHRPA